MVRSAHRQNRCASIAMNPFHELPSYYAFSRVVHVLHAIQMKSYVNASQKRSLDEQLAQG